MTYPESLRYLAKKYNIAIEEVITKEGRAEQLERDSLFIINQFAADYFEDKLWKSEEGQTIGLSYFKERGFRETTIKQFQLGYSVDSYDAFVRDAKAKGYQLPLLNQLGLIRNKSGRNFAFFRARVMFPIHNLSGKVVAFAGRTLSADKKIPKYINSPETAIYNKSKTLYGLYFARKAIRQVDNCWLVEGYTDVISLVQAGIEQVVASSGTSLTEGQIGLIKRYTQNITLLFDGDPAGLKAALRGVDLVLEAGLNVKIVVLPEGEDPDSFVRQQGKTGFEAYVEEKATDFIFFKTNLLLEETANDPIKKSEAIRSIISTLAKINDPIKRQLYVQKCSQLLVLSEQIIINAINKLKRQQLQKHQDQSSKPKKNLPPPPPPIPPMRELPPHMAPPNDYPPDYRKEEEYPPEYFNPEHFGNLPIPPPPIQEGAEQAVVEEQKRPPMPTTPLDYQEKYLMEILLQYGDREINELPVAAYIVCELLENTIQNTNYQQIVKIYEEHLENGEIPKLELFTTHHKDNISKTVIDLIHSPYEISDNWELKHEIFITLPEKRYKANTIKSLNHYRLRYLNYKLKQNLLAIQQVSEEANLMELLEHHQAMLLQRNELAELLGIAIL